MKIHPLQIKLLSLAEEDMLSGLSLRDIGKLIGEEHPQKVKYHLEQLQDKGLIYIDHTTGSIEFLREEGGENISIPLYGLAQCGQGTLFADEKVEDMVSFPAKLLGRYQNNIFATQAEGHSMYPRIQHGDFVIVEHSLIPQDNKVCLVLAEGEPRIKHFMYIDREMIALKSFNEDFATQIFPNQEVEVLGIVRKVVSEL